MDMQSNLIAADSYQLLLMPKIAMGSCNGVGLPQPICLVVNVLSLRIVYTWIALGALRRCNVLARRDTLSCEHLHHKDRFGMCSQKRDFRTKILVKFLRIYVELSQFSAE